MVATEAEPLFAQEAKERQQEAGMLYGRGQKVPAKLQEAKSQGEASHQAGKAMQVGGRYVSQAKKLKDEHPMWRPG